MTNRSKRYMYSRKIWRSIISAHNRYIPGTPTDFWNYPYGSEIRKRVYESAMIEENMKFFLNGTT